MVVVGLLDQGKAEVGAAERDLLLLKLKPTLDALTLRGESAVEIHLCPVAFCLWE